MPLRPSLQAGDRFGRYLVQGPIGPGDLGETLFAAHGRERYVMEILPDELGGNVAFVSRLEKEIRAAVRIGHANVLSAAEVVRAEGRVGIATPYRPGPAVEALYPGGALHVEITPALVAWIGAESAAGLAHAHRLPVVHRGVSPAAIRLGLDGRVRVTGFGVSDALRALGRRSPIDPAVLAPYLAPEQIEGASDARSDVWSLGVVLWELLARSRLFRRESRAETLEAIQWLEVPPLDEIREDVPQALEDAIRRALEREPEKRWPGAKELEDALRANLPADMDAVRAALSAGMEDVAKEERARIGSLPPMTPEPHSAIAVPVKPSVDAPPAQRAVAPPKPPPVAAPRPAEPPKPLPTPPPIAAPRPVEPQKPAPTPPPPAAPRPVEPPRQAPVAAPAPAPPQPSHTPPPMPATRRRRTGLVAAAVGVVVFAGVIGLLIVLFPEESSRTAAASPASTAPVAVPTAAPSTASVETAAPMVNLRVEANRMLGWVEVDLGARQDLPLDLQLRAGTRVHLRLGAPGYLPRETDAVAGETPRVRLWLGRPGEVEPAGPGMTAAPPPASNETDDPTFRPLDERPSNGLEKNPFGN